MSTQLLSLGNGALTVVESGGNLVAAFSETKSVGGGEAAGIIQVVGTGSITLSGLQALKLAEALLNHVLPAAAQTIAQPIENFINSEVAAS
jgi:hypothetical protein